MFVKLLTCLSFLLTFLCQQWFDLYYSEVRPKLLTSKEVIVSEEEECFFISTSGKPIHNACTDLKRLHVK